MVHLHGAHVQRLADEVRGVPREHLLAVPVDVGKLSAKALVCDFAGEVVVTPFEFPMNRDGVRQLVKTVESARRGRSAAAVRLGIEAAGHYHRPLAGSSLLPAAWRVLELNPAHVTEQRRVLGKRGVKTDAIDLVAIADLITAGRGYETRTASAQIEELRGWVAHRQRRVAVRSALKMQLIGQLDRCFPGLGKALPDPLGTKVGRLIAAEFSDPERLHRMGASRFQAFARRRGLIVRIPMAERLVAAAGVALLTTEAEASRRILGEDLVLLDELDRQVAGAEQQIVELLPSTPFAVLCCGPLWGPVRVGRYAAAVRNPSRWPSHRQLYRASGLTPVVYESAGRRFDGGITREGSVELRVALLGLGTGLWLGDDASRRYAAALRDRGKRGRVIATALARRACKIAFAMVRDQAPFDPARWA